MVERETPDREGSWAYEERRGDGEQTTLGGFFALKRDSEIRHEIEGYVEIK